MAKQLTNEEFLNRLKENNVEYMPLEEYKGMYTRINFKCNKNHVFDAVPYDICNHRHKCPYCSNKKVLRGFNDMWTTNKEMAEMLLDKNDGYIYTSGSSKKTKFVCPNCGNILYKAIDAVNKIGLSCDRCRDGMSYPEKFIYGLLTQLNIEFEHDKTMEWSENKRYDFYISSMKLIIETHGIQHYNNSFNFNNNQRKSRSLSEEISNDIFKMNLALDNGIKYYIELDCRKSNLEYIKNSIINSELNKLFDLSGINWNEIENYCNTSRVIEVCDLWNSGIKDTTRISEITGIHISSVISYLKRASNGELCDYKPKYHEKKHKEDVYKKVEEMYTNYTYEELSNLLDISKSYVIYILKELGLYEQIHKQNTVKSKIENVLCVESGKIYKSLHDVVQDGYNVNAVRNCLQGLSKTSGGCHWDIVNN